MTGSCRKADGRPLTVNIKHNLNCRKHVRSVSHSNRDIAHFPPTESTTPTCIQDTAHNSKHQRKNKKRPSKVKLRKRKHLITENNLVGYYFSLSLSTHIASGRRKRFWVKTMFFSCTKGGHGRQSPCCTWIQSLNSLARAPGSHSKELVFNYLKPAASVIR